MKKDNFTDRELLIWEVAFKKGKEKGEISTAIQFLLVIFILLSLNYFIK